VLSTEACCCSCCCWEVALDCCLEARSTGVVDVLRGVYRAWYRVRMLWIMDFWGFGRFLHGRVELRQRLGGNPHMCGWECCQPHLCLVGWSCGQPGIACCTAYMCSVREYFSVEQTLQAELGCCLPRDCIVLLSAVIR
jgi:hypothetical protein